MPDLRSNRETRRPACEKCGGELSRPRNFFCEECCGKIMQSIRDRVYSQSAPPAAFPSP